MKDLTFIIIRVNIFNHFLLQSHCKFHQQPFVYSMTQLDRRGQSSVAIFRYEGVVKYRKYNN